MERRTYRRSPGSNAWAFDERGSEPQLPPLLSDSDGQPDPREFESLVPKSRSSIAMLIMAGGLAVSALAILVAVFQYDLARVLVGKATAFMRATTTEQSATQGASNQPAVPQIPLNNPARVSNPRSLANANASNPRAGTPAREAIVSAYQTALQSQAAAAAPTPGAAAAPPRTLDAEILAALMTRANGLLALGDIAAARLLLERAANAQDATAAFLLAQTYDPVVLGVRDTRSITPDPVLAGHWYRKAASFGSADAQQRLTQLQH